MNFYIFLIIVILLILLIRLFFQKIKKLNRSIYKNLENNPKLITNCYDQHIRRLNKYRESNYKGTSFYISSKGGIYYYSKKKVRIYI